MRRAYRPEEKQSRRQAILAAALQLFRETPYADLRMTDLAQRLELGKGTLYLYFPTKESLFLAVLQAEMGAWFQQAALNLEATQVGTDPVAVAEGLVLELTRRPLLPGLQALLHGVLERNIPAAEAQAFARFLQAGVVRVGEQLERVLPGLVRGLGPLYLIRFHGLVIGSQLMAARPPAVRAALQAPDMDLFDFSFEGLLRGTAVELLVGMLNRPGPLAAAGAGLGSLQSA
ncbi:MAG: TetR/AcrR family transcriptional regulator [Holophaga sp.]|nr:TetR/AcrR family transcriptional regulator [Holophaga sp.]